MIIELTLGINLMPKVSYLALGNLFHLFQAEMADCLISIQLSNARHYPLAQHRSTSNVTAENSHTRQQL